MKKIYGAKLKGETDLSQKPLKKNTHLPVSFGGRNRTHTLPFSFLLIHVLFPLLYFFFLFLIQIGRSIEMDGSGGDGERC